MAWTAPRTWVAGAVLTAAQLNTDVRDNLNAIGVWNSWTPVLTATTTNPTLGTGSVQSGNYIKYGQMLIVEGRITFGTSGVAAGSGSYLISVPPSTTITPTSAAIPLGQARILDSSAVTIGIANVYYQDGTHVGLNMPSTTTVGGFGTVTHATPMAWAASDSIDFKFMCFAT